MNCSMLVVLASVAIASSAGSLLRCSEESFAALGGALPSSSSSSEYSICSDGVVRKVACPHGHTFDASSHSCTIAHEVQQDEFAETSRQLQDLCTNPSEVEVFPHPLNCSQYIICFGLVPIEQSCGNGLLFNSKLGVCDIPSNVVCGYSCPAVDDPYNPVWLPDSRMEDCARHYLCFQGNPIPFLCPNNLYFDPVSTTCSYPQYSTCTVAGVHCNGNRTENVANPRSCTTYYTCSYGFPHYRVCQVGEHFSSELHQCVFGPCPPTPSPSPTSTTGTTTTVQWNTTSTSFTPTVNISTTISFTSSTTPTTAEVTTSSSSATTTEVANTTSTTGSTTEMTTRIETTSAATTGVITTTEAATTSEVESTTGPATTTEGMTTTGFTTTVNPMEICAGISGSAVLPYPGNCAWYILCLNGLGAVAQCGPNLIFSINTGTCVPGDPITCTLA